MSSSAPLGDGPRATAVTIPRFPSTLAAGIGIDVTGAAGRTSGVPLSTPVGWGGDKVGKECRPGDDVNLLYVCEHSQ